MIRGTTPTLTFTLPFPVNTLAEAYITFTQRKEIVLEKSLTECSQNEDCLSVTLTQEETLGLQCHCETEIQLRVKTLQGEALASDIIKTDTGRILKDGVI